jgi:hypothetical protein
MPRPDYSCRGNFVIKALSFAMAKGLDLLDCTLTKSYTESKGSLGLGRRRGVFGPAKNQNFAELLEK